MRVRERERGIEKRKVERWREMEREEEKEILIKKKILKNYIYVYKKRN